MRYHPALPRGFSQEALRSTRRRRGLPVEIHHIIPRQHADHPTLRAFAYDTEAGYNLVFLPTKQAAALGTARPVHTGGHPEYNQFVRNCLDCCDTHILFVYVLFLLHKGCRGRFGIPWR